MALFDRTDPKDALIETLREERDHLRERVRELEKQLLAVAQPGAYRLVHREVSPNAPPAKPPFDPYVARGQVYKPETTLAGLIGKESES